jgi:hypothetical protein
MSDLAHLAADTLPVWRDGVVAGLAGIVIVCLWLAAELFGPTP